MAIPPPAPLPHPLWQNLPMCPVTGSSEDGSHGLLVVFMSRKNLFRARRPGPCQRRRYGKALQMLWQGPGRRALKRFFWTQVWREGNTYRQCYTCYNTRSHFGPCNSLRCEMAPWRDWTSLTYVYMAALCGGGLTFGIPFSRDFQ